MFFFICSFPLFLFFPVYFMLFTLVLCLLLSFPPLPWVVFKWLGFTAGNAEEMGVFLFFLSKN